MADACKKSASSKDAKQSQTSCGDCCKSNKEFEGGEGVTWECSCKCCCKSCKCENCQCRCDCKCDKSKAIKIVHEDGSVKYRCECVC